MSHKKRTGRVLWCVPMPSGVNRLSAGHGLVFGVSPSGVVHAYLASDGTARYGRGENGLSCEGYALVDDALMVVLAKQKHGEVWTRVAHAYDVATGDERGKTELQLDGPVGTTCLTKTTTHTFVALSKSSELLALDTQAQEVVLLALEKGASVTNLIFAGALVVAMVSPHQGLRGYSADERLVFSLDNAMPLAWGDDGLLANVNGVVCYLDATGSERWRKPFDLSSRMTVAGSLIIAVDHLGMVHALDAQTGETRWTTTSGTKKAAALNPVVCDGYAWVLNALGKVVAFDLADGNKAYAPNETHPNSRGFLTTGRSVFVHQQSDGGDTLTAMEMSFT